MIVDAQVHLWKANTPDRPWLPNRVAQLPEPFTDRKTRADDGRSRRRPRRHRPAVLGGRSQRLRARGGAPIPGAFRRHGPHSGERSEIGKAVAGLEEAAGHARHQADVSSAAMDLADRRHRRLVLAGWRKNMVFR